MTISLAPSIRHWLACAFAIAVIAAALPMSTPSAEPRPQPVAVPSWTGFYIGVHGGWGSSRTRVEDSTFRLAYDPVAFNSSGNLAGAQMGADWQFGNVVVGGEIDASWASLKGRSAQDPIFTFGGFSTNVRALVTGTGRVGYAAGSYLGYAKAGIAWADLDLSSAIYTPRPRVIEHTRTGVTVGAGLEIMLIRNLSAKVEYDFIYLGSTAMNLGTNRGSQDVEHALHLVKGGLNWRFSDDYLLARR